MSDEEHDMPVDDLAEPAVPEPAEIDHDMPYIHIGDEAGDAGVAVAKADRITVM